MRETYATVDVILGGNRVTDLITLLKNKRMIVQENGRKYTFKPDFHYREVRAKTKKRCSHRLTGKTARA